MDVQQIAFVSAPVRRLMLRAMGLDLGRNAYFERRVFMSSALITVGDDSAVNVGCHLDAAARLTIGRNVSIGQNTTILTGSHPIGGPERRVDRANKTDAPVTIEDGVWICAGVLVLPGVTIAKGCVIAAGSVVTKSTEPNGLYAGNPARLLRMLPMGGEAAAVEPASPVAPPVASA